jgi:hypothetical protein
MELWSRSWDCMLPALITLVFRFLAEALTENSTLEILGVADNEFNSVGVLHFLGLLPAMKGLKEVNGFIDQLKEEQACVALVESLRENEVFCRISKTPDAYEKWRLVATLSLQLKDEIQYPLKMNEYGLRLFYPLWFASFRSPYGLTCWPRHLLQVTGDYCITFYRTCLPRVESGRQVIVRFLDEQRAT